MNILGLVKAHAERFAHATSVRFVASFSSDETTSCQHRRSRTSSLLHHAQAALDQAEANSH